MYFYFVPAFLTVLVALYLGLRDLNPNRNADVEPRTPREYIARYWPKDIPDYCARLNATGHDCITASHVDLCDHCHTLEMLEMEWAVVYGAPTKAIEEAKVTVCN